MKILFTGSNGLLGKKYISMFPDTIPVSVRYSDPESLIKLSNELKTADVLIHAGANLNPKSWEESIQDNALLPQSIVSMAGQVNPGVHIILISSSMVLGEDCKPKLIRDMTHYAASKYIMEEISCGEAKNPITIVRFSSLFYAENNRDGLSKMVWTAAKNGNVVAADCKRDFIPMWAACEWINKLCNNMVWYNKTINLASGNSVNMLDVAHHLVKKYGVSSHHTALPDYTNVCYKFNADDTKSLGQINFDMYKLIDDYYEAAGKGK